MPPRDRPFFARDARTVAQELLGDVLVHDAGERLSGRIVETEAYLGPEDPASHARHGRTDRAAIMWDRPGTVYVYRIYGMYDMLNVVAAEKGRASAVLIRAIEPVDGVATMRQRREGKAIGDGPGKLCEAMGVTRDRNGDDATKGSLFVEAGPDPDRVEATGRVGVVEDVDEPRRYLDAGSDAVSQ